MKRLDVRVDAAIARASRKYFDSLTAVGPSGSLGIKAVKRVMNADEYPAIGGNTTARRFEFVVSRLTFDALCKRLSGDSSLTFQDIVSTFRKTKLVERRENKETTYQLDASTPYLDNSPDGSSVRLFAFEIRT